MTDEVTAPAAVTGWLTGKWGELPPDARRFDPAPEPYRRAISALGESWQSVLRQILDRLTVPPYAAVIRSEPDGGTAAGGAAALLAAIGASVGTIANPYRDTVPALPALQTIEPKPRSNPDQVWEWHTDSANWPVPNDYSALACVRPAPAGGATQLLCLDSLRASEGWCDTTLAPLWERDIEWPVERVLGGGSFTDRCITPKRLRYRRELMKRPPSDDYRRAVTVFHELADRTVPSLATPLSSGDVLVFDNRKTLHRAGPSDDPERRRLLLRAKIRCR